MKPRTGRNPMPAALASAISHGVVTSASAAVMDEMMKIPRKGKSKFSKELGKRRNPSLDEDEDIRRAGKVSKEWHGRGAREVLEISEIERYNDTAVILGDLEELGVLGNNLEQWSISFKTNRPKLTCDLEKRNLEFVGGDQVLGIDGKGKREVPLGWCYQIVYYTDKHHLEDSNGEFESYEHFFGEEFYRNQGYEVQNYETSDDFFEELLADGVVEKAIEKQYLPLLVYDTANEKIRLVGGEYDITELGIKD